MLSGTLYMGRLCTFWATWQEARESWRKRRTELIERSEMVWWRASTVIDVPPPPGVDIRQVLREDL